MWDVNSNDNIYNLNTDGNIGRLVQVSSVASVSGVNKGESTSTWKTLLELTLQTQSTDLQSDQNKCNSPSKGQWMI